MKTRNRLFATAGIATLLCTTLFATPALADDGENSLDTATIQQTQVLEEDEAGFTPQEEEVQDQMLEKAGPGTRGCEKVANPHSFFSEYSAWRTFQTVKDQYYLSCFSSPESTATDAGAWGGYRNGAVNPEDLEFVGSAILRSDAAATYVEMNDAYKAETGEDLQVNASYRSYAKQVTTWIKDTPIAAYPGSSGHGWGTSLDLATAGDYVEQGEWLEENAEEYGWINPTWAQDGTGPKEAWHYDFESPSHPIICDNIFQPKDECNAL